MIQLKRSLVFALLFCALAVQAQNVAINADGSKANPNAILDIKSADKGLLIPRVTSEARLKISNTQGLLVYDINTNSFWYNTGRQWLSMSTSSESMSTGTAWLLTGNAGTVDGTHFLGTTDNVPLNIRVNNQRSGRLDPTLRTTLWGYQAGANLSTGTNNTGVGAGALFLTNTGSDNTAVGADALQNNQGGFSNTAIGRLALFSNTIGAGNTALGQSALAFNTDGDDNVGIGSFTIFTGGDRNTAVGNSSQGCLFAGCAPKGTDNTSVGYTSLVKFTGNRNTAIGSFAQVIGGTGIISFGNNNTVVGAGGLINGSFSNSSILGADALVQGSNSTALGSGAVANTSNKVRIGNAAVTVIEGQVPFTTPSDGRYKFGVQEDVKGLDFIMQLRPVTYQFDVKKFDAELGIPADKMNEGYNDALQLRRSGFIAQEVEQAALKTGYNFSGIIKPKNAKEHYSLSYDAFVVPLVKAVQEQEQVINDQQKTIQDLQRQLDELKNAVKKLQSGN